jgi:myosin heavy subunit
LGEADPALASVLLKIASNNAFAPVSKFQAALKAVQSHYLKKIASRDEALSQASSKNQRFTTLFNQFLIDVSIALTGSPVKLDDVLSSDAGQKLISDATELRSALSGLMHQCQTQSQSLNLLTDFFKGYYPEGSDAISQVKGIKAAWNKKLRQLSARSHKLRECKRSQESATATISELNSRVATLQAQLSGAEQTIDQLAGQQQSLTEKLQQVQIANEEQQSVMRNEYENELEKLAQANDEMQARMRSEIAEWQTNADKLIAQHEADEQQIASLKRRVHTLLNAKRQQEDAYSELATTIAEKDELTAAQQRQEKAAIAKTHETSIANLRQQLEQARNDAEQLGRYGNDADQKARKAAAEIAKLEKERQRAAAEIQSLRRELEREKQVAAAVIDAARMTTESSFYQKLEDQRAKSDAEKRQIWLFGIDTFRSFFDPSDTVGEIAFRRVLEKAKSEFMRLTKADAVIRGMVGAREQQPTEDAVAQLLLEDEIL